MLGVGAGDPNDWGFARVCEPCGLRDRLQRFDEALDVLVGLWSGRAFSYARRHFRIDNVIFLPSSVQ
jgi:alkanesulfonate monooxygenase SsuD/methylene tetrahydromethanopterin reductase-like flavin-dependent oxidoreductase (luciferase family)